MVERPLSMREVPGSMPGSSNYFVLRDKGFTKWKILRNFRIALMIRLTYLLMGRNWFICHCVIKLRTTSPFMYVRMAERSKAPDSRDSLFL